jgi:hypothetical protein
MNYEAQMIPKSPPFVRMWISAVQRIPVCIQAVSFLFSAGALARIYFDRRDHRRQLIRRNSGSGHGPVIFLHQAEPSRSRWLIAVLPVHPCHLIVSLVPHTISSLIPLLVSLLLSLCPQHPSPFGMHACAI